MRAPASLLLTATLATVACGAVAAAQATEPSTVPTSMPIDPTTAPTTDATTAPTTAPTTSPTTGPVAVDASTPKAAVRTFARALEAGDAAALRAVLFAGTDAERTMADAMVHMAVALASLRRSATAQFGKADVDAALGDPDAKYAAAQARVESAVETVEGDVASVGRPGEPPAVLRRADGRWQMVVGTLAPTDSPAALHERVRGIQTQADVLDALAADVRAGKYRSMREALTVLHGQMMRAAVDAKDAEPATRPAAGNAE